MTSLFAFARITPKSEYLAHARDAILGIIEQTRLEPGCIQFELYEGIDEADLYLYEEWRTVSDLKDHYEQPYTKAIFDQYDQWLTEPVQVIKMHQVK